MRRKWGRSTPFQALSGSVLDAQIRDGNNFDLTPAEAGHPIWGPVFRAVKADVAKADAAKAKGK